MWLFWRTIASRRKLVKIKQLLLSFTLPGMDQFFQSDLFLLISVAIDSKDFDAILLLNSWGLICKSSVRFVFKCFGLIGVVSISVSRFNWAIGIGLGLILCYYRCGHCKKLAPEYEKLGASFKKAKSVLIAKVSVVLFLYLAPMFEIWMIDCFNLSIVVKVDCDEHKTVCTKYGVSGYPTIQWFPKGSLEPQK